MRKRPLLPMAVAFLLFFPGPGLCEGNGSCLTSGGAHSWIEGGETFTAERYELTVECATEPGAGTVLKNPGGGR